MNVSDIDPKGKELFEEHLKHGTAMMTEEGEPCNNAEIVKALTGEELPPSKEEAEAAARAEVIAAAKDPKKIKVVARERFLAVLGKTLTHIGLSEGLAGRVLASVMLQPTRIRTDFAYKPETGMGVVWGWSNGGSVSFPIPLKSIEMGTLISLKTGQSIKLSGAAGTVGCRERGYWIMAYRLDEKDVKVLQESTTASVAEEVQARGQTKHTLAVDELGLVPDEKPIGIGNRGTTNPPVTIYDDAPFIPNNPAVVSDAALKTGNDAVSVIDEALKSTSVM